MSMTELIFIRHGETDWNRARRFQGCIDIALNATGLEQARHTADRLQDHRLAAVYSSHLGRARETARPIAEALGLAVAIEPELRESLVALRARVFEQMHRLAKRHAGQTVVAVTHGGVLDSIYRIASGLAADEPRRFELNNASINRIGWNGEQFSVLGWGDVSHLAKMSI